MRVYLFIEHYPNPYKPWIDTQIVQLLRAGHDVRVFAEASFTSTIHDEVREWRLSERTSYYPATLKGLKRHAPRAAGRLITGLPGAGVRAVRAAGAAPSLKHGLLFATRALLLPREAPDVCYIHNLVAASRLTFLRRLYPNARLCLYFHGGEVGGQPKVTGERTVFDAMHAVVTSTRFAAAQAVERGCQPDKVAIVPLGFYPPAYTPSQPRRYRPEGPLRVVSVGRLSPEKGFIHAMKAVDQLVRSDRTDFTFTLVGSGLERAQLQAWGTEHGLDHVVRFAGEKTRAEVAAILDASDVFLLPSIVTDVWAETQATVVEEALLIRCITVTTAAGGVPESNAPVMHEFMVPPGDASALAAQLQRLLARSPAELGVLAAQGRAFALERYDIAVLMERILDHAMGRLPAADAARYGQSPNVQ